MAVKTVVIQDSNLIQDGYTTGRFTTGSGDKIYVGYNGEYNERYESIIRFDLPLDFKNSSVSSVYLDMYIDYNATNYTPTVTLNDSYSEWSEDTLSQGYFPIGGAYYTSGTYGISGTGWKRFDISELAKKWASGNLPNNGIIFYTQNYGGNYAVGFSSRTYSDVTKIPKLTLTYNPLPNTAPTTPNNFTSPVRGEKRIYNKEYSVKWGASTDAENNKLVYDLEFFDGTLWNSLGKSLTTIDFIHRIPNIIATNAQYRVRAIDEYGLLSEYTYSDPFEVSVINVVESNVQYYSNASIQVNTAASYVNSASITSNKSKLNVHLNRNVPASTQLRGKATQSVKATKINSAKSTVNSKATLSQSNQLMKFTGANFNVTSKLVASHGFAMMLTDSLMSVYANKMQNTRLILNPKGILSAKSINIRYAKSNPKGKATLTSNAQSFKTIKANIGNQSNMFTSGTVQAHLSAKLYNKSSLLMDTGRPDLSGFDSIIGNKPRTLKMEIAMPSGRKVGNLPEAYDVNQTTNLGQLNEISFKVPYQIDKRNKLIRNPNVDKLKDRYLIKTRIGDIIEWYIINETKDSMDQNGDVKEIHAFSLGYELRDKMLRTYKTDPKNLSTILREVLSSTIWSLGYVDVDFDIKYRPFDVVEKTVLDFIYEVAETFNAVVEFDTVNRQLNFVRTDRTNNLHPLRLSYRKYLKTLNKTSVPDDLVTRLLVFGKEGISIQKINPTGSNYIESFEYFLYPFQRDENRKVISKSAYMEDDLCHAILDYQELLEGKQGQFKTLLERLESKQAQVTLLQNEITLLEIDLEIIEDRLQVAKSQGNDTSSIEQEKSAKQSQINSKQSTLNGLNTELNSINSDIQQLQDDIALEKVFSPQLLKERNKYIIEATWENEYISDEQELYDEAVKQFENMKKPKTLLEVDIVNFLEVLEEKRNWDKLSIGDDIFVHYEQFNLDVLAKIITIDYDYSNQSIKLTIANVREIEDDEEKFIKQLYSSISTSKKVDMSETKWNNTSDKLGEINDIINNQWDANAREISFGVNNSITMSRRGLMIESSDNPNNVLIAQNGILAISNDKGNSWKQAITASGIVGERIFGKLIAGVNLVVENDSGKYRMDSNGFTIEGGSLKIIGGLPKDQLDPSFADELVVRGKTYNGVTISTEEGLVVTRSDERVKATFNATDGLKFSVKRGTQYVDALYYDPVSANLNVDGVINARDLKVQGKSVLTADQLQIDGRNINYITTNQLVAGTAKIGKAMIEEGIFMSPTSVISWGQIGDKPTVEQLGGVSNTSSRFTYIDQNGVYSGTISADKIVGGTITGIDWMSNHHTTPFNIYIGSKSDKAMEVYYDSLNLYRQGSRYFRVDPTGVYHNGQPLNSVAVFG
ncbi:phage tail spike protein [Bacillus sp. UMB0728]|uniref:phage tail spike protein n=1 Tax=Bacillus sp. UMB0728 TaxID=2066052 RepID=UPI000C75900E|nr:phage tail spike protein [Bacillus sp. UMB0728]PLR72330.1 hypothetical protein CYJ37_12300 [Bacillus sp. UMB0728]